MRVSNLVDMISQNRLGMFETPGSTSVEKPTLEQIVNEINAQWSWVCLHAPAEKLREALDYVKYGSAELYSNQTQTRIWWPTSNGVPFLRLLSVRARYKMSPNDTPTPGVLSVCKYVEPWLFVKAEDSGISHYLYNDTNDSGEKIYTILGRDKNLWIGDGTVVWFNGVLWNEASPNITAVEFNGIVRPEEIDITNLNVDIWQHRIPLTLVTILVDLVSAVFLSQKPGRADEARNMRNSALVMLGIQIERRYN